MTVLVAEDGADHDPPQSLVATTLGLELTWGAVSGVDNVDAPPQDRVAVCSRNLLQTNKGQERVSNHSQDAAFPGAVARRGCRL